VSLEPVFLPAFFCIRPVGWFWSEQASHKLTCLITSHGSAQSSGWKMQLACGVLFNLARTEWVAPCKNLESHDANGPDVHSFRIGHFLAPRVSIILDNTLHLWSHVQRRASSGMCNHVAINSSFAETEVCKFHPPFGASSDYKNILCEIVSADAYFGA
jgi:hypothetical protein